MNPVVFYGACPEKQEHDAAYRLLEIAVSESCGIPSLPEIRRSETGKPFFPRYPSIHFNLSHSLGGILCGIHDAPLGVDIERLRTAPAHLRGDLTDAEFFLQWTWKEATIKQRGLGLAALLSPVELSPLCVHSTTHFPPYLLAVCPSYAAEICWVRHNLL